MTGAVDIEFVAQNAVDAISVGSLYAVLALGIALIFGVMRLINFAHGELIMVGGFALVFLAGIPWPFFVIVMIAIVVLVALASERIAFRPLRGADPATLLVSSFALSYLLQNVAAATLGSLPRTAIVFPGLSDTVDVASLSVQKLNILTVVLVALLLGGLTVFLKRTPLGVHMRAAAEDFEMARLVGVRADRVIASAFAISGVLAGVAALLLVARSGSASPTMGLTPVLFAFIATILGGMGSLSGAALGGFVLGVLTVALQVSLPVELRPFRDAFVFALVIFVLLVRPQGIIVPRSAQVRV